MAVLYSIEMFVEIPVDGLAALNFTDGFVYQSKLGRLGTEKGTKNQESTDIALVVL
jgi:hypothetical protein